MLRKKYCGNSARNLETKLQRSNVLAQFCRHAWDGGLNPGKCGKSDMKLMVLPSFSSTSDFLLFYKSNNPGVREREKQLQKFNPKFIAAVVTTWSMNPLGVP